LGVAALARSKDDLSRRSLALISNHQDVVAGALQQLGEYIARKAGSVSAKDPLIGFQAFHLCAGGRREIVEDLLQAGVCRLNAKALAVPGHGRVDRVVVCRPVRNFCNWRGGLNGYRSFLLRRGDSGCAGLDMVLSRFMRRRGFGGRCGRLRGDSWNVQEEWGKPHTGPHDGCNDRKCNPAVILRSSARECNP